MRRIIAATRNTLNGLRAGLATEAALRQELVALIAAVPLAAWIARGLAEWALLIFAVLMVIAVELANTAIEKLADRVESAHDAAIGTVKDLGSAAVAVALLACGLLWLAALAARLGILT